MATLPELVPDPVAALDAGDFFRVILLNYLAPCSEEDCDSETRLGVESRDAALRPVCAGHAHVLFADWMVGA